jgi:hypothetical protein
MNLGVLATIDLGAVEAILRTDLYSFIQAIIPTCFA